MPLARFGMDTNEPPFEIRVHITKYFGKLIFPAIPNVPIEFHIEVFLTQHRAH